jgi:hypothetical protein
MYMTTNSSFVVKAKKDFTSSGAHNQAALSRALMSKLQCSKISLPIDMRTMSNTASQI